MHSVSITTLFKPDSNADRRALKDEHIVNLQLEALQKKFKTLRRHERTLHSSALDKQAKIKTAFLEYAKVTCREFCDKVHKKLPRELRDKIWSYVAGYEDVRIRSHADSKYDYFATNSETRYRHPNVSTRGVDPWWDPDFVGPDVVREIGENYYRSSCFQFDDNFGLISKFRVTDQWNLGFLPISFVSNVGVCIRCHHYDFDSITNTCEDSVADDAAGGAGGSDWEVSADRTRSVHPTKVQSSLLLVELESLFGFKLGTAMTIKAVVNRRERLKPLEKQEWMCENIIPFIFPSVQRLIEAGYRVRLILSGYEFAKVTDQFVSGWNPRSVEDLNTSFWEYVETEQKRIQQALDDDEDDFDFGLFS